MTVIEAIYSRHSVRQYTTDPIEEEVRLELDAFVAECNEKSGLNMEIWYDDPVVFDSRIAKLAKFKNVRNFIMVAGKDHEGLEETCGYFGELVVLKCQQMGLNTCWVGGTFNKKMADSLVHAGEKMVAVIALGYGANQGEPHAGKFLEDVVATQGAMPTWFRRGAEAALLAPTAMCQQKFKIGMIDGEPAIKVSGRGYSTKVDLGIVKCHFELASGHRVL